MPDLRLAEALGFDRPRNFRKLLQTHESGLASYSRVCCVAEQTSELGGRPGSQYWLTIPQALFICTKSEAPRAQEVVRELIELWMAVYEGKTLPTDTQIISDLFARHLQPVRDDISELKGGVSRIEGRVERIDGNVISLANRTSRRDFKARAINVWKRTLIEDHSGRCPCGCGQPLVDKLGRWVAEKHIDHFYDKGRNKRNEGWPLRKECHERLTQDADERLKAVAYFTVFQKNCDRVEKQAFAKRWHAKARASSKTTQAPTQLKMWD
jgi:hypothetical protein